uniref:probable 28S rRNA (cytosine-C(5))-methyltransferase n=1 Tax=Ciona intestinalis TaxID=7719 RepID=UPI000180C464|nr:probable 28S rRNA (cytosine-C(5))-methyltransferase [Ciona intestinalis]|eukprot:XP_002131278.1 probable 28S rRNA (cytosine-C(5))-methyltransferase [Ciona intestinalis]
MALYKSAEDVLNQVEAYKSSVKKAVFSTKFRNPKQLCALVMETLKYKAVLEDVLQQTKLIQNTKGISRNIALPLLYDFLIGKGIRCGGKFKKLIKTRKSAINAAFARIKLKKKVSKTEDLVEKSNFTLPKYLRVNTLLTTTTKVMETLNKDGFTRVDCSVNEIVEKQFSSDPDIPNLLVFHFSTDFHDHGLYKLGHLIFQDKSSCMPAFVLNPSPNSHVIDACAAPGNKTSHLSAIMNNTGKLFAIDRSSERIEVMKKQLKKASVKNCEVINSDFLILKPTDEKFKQVEYILVDPSCTGSGIISRQLEHTEEKDSKCSKRLESLSKFQLKVLNHALSFPNVKRVVYSTCSIHEEENELIVKLAVEQNSNFDLKKVLPKWHNRGLISDSFNAEKCVRCDPNVDFTNGFFVALFEKKMHE